MADTKKILILVIMILDIIIGALSVLVGVNKIVYFFTDLLDLDILDAITWIFYGICITILGLILIFFELKVKRQEILKEMGLLGHYLGKGSYVFFISILSYNHDDSMWGGKNVSYGTAIGILSAILCWILYGCMGHKEREH